MRLEITHAGIEVFDPPQDIVARIRAELTVSAKATHSVPHPYRFKVYQETGNGKKFIVPGHWGRQRGGVFESRDFQDTRVNPPVFCDDRVRFSGNLRAGAQADTVKRSLEQIRATGGALLSLPCGGGKTVCALSIAVDLGVKTAILVNKAFLADQWISRIKTFVPGARVSRVQGSTVDTSGDFVICMIQSVVSRRVDLACVGLLIFDECHHAPAKVFSTAIRNCKYTLGLTATPVRKDGLERLAEWALGGLVYDETPDTRHATVDVYRYKSPAYLQPPPTNRAGQIDHPSIITKVSEDPERTARIVQLIHGLPRDRQILVLSHRRAQCQLVAEMLGSDAGLFIGGAKRAADPPDSRIIVSTFALVSEAFDVPRLNALVMLTPASDVTQTVGRILRGAGDPLVIDMHDQWSVCFAQAKKRSSQYSSSGFAVRFRGFLPDTRPSVPSVPVVPVIPKSREYAFMEDM